MHPLFELWISATICRRLVHQPSASCRFCLRKLTFLYFQNFICAFLKDLSIKSFLHFNQFYARLSSMQGGIRDLSFLWIRGVSKKSWRGKGWDSRGRRIWRKLTFLDNYFTKIPRGGGAEGPPLPVSLCFRCSKIITHKSEGKIHFFSRLFALGVSPKAGWGSI